MNVRAAHHIAILTPNLAALEAFYTQTLGFPVARRWDDVGIVFIDVGGLWLELTQIEAANQSQPHMLDQGIGINHLAFQVDDVDITYQELVARGVRVIAEPAQYKEVRSAFFADPDGNVLEIIEDPAR